jgi:thymidylate synthase (FAD)
MKVSVLEHTPKPDQLCGQMAALCYNSENWESALRMALRGGHESVIEHASVTFLIEGVSRALLTQLTRHRIASFSVQSQRYVDMTGFEAVIPESIAQSEALAVHYSSLMGEINGFYRSLCDAGVPKEDARMVLPNACETKLGMTMNCRELRHFFALRTCNRAQWEIRQLADAMLERCKRIAPIIFEDAGCACMAGKPCPEGKMSCGKPRAKK